MCVRETVCVCVCVCEYVGVISKGRHLEAASKDRTSFVQVSE